MLKKKLKFQSAAYYFESTFYACVVTKIYFSLDIVRNISRSHSSLPWWVDGAGQEALRCASAAIPGHSGQLPSAFFTSSTKCAHSVKRTHFVE